jgi:TetR/AcrR family transcriptional regulator, cholesterol catabolism regulator
MEPRLRNGPKTSAEIREAAAELFFKHGYEATSLRAVAGQVGIKVGSLYNHMGSKDELLLDIMLSVMDQITPLVESAVEAAGSDPVARLEAGIGAHICFHAQHARDTLIGNSELRALTPDQRRLILKRRHEYEELIQRLVEEAATSVGVELLDPRLQTYAVLALGMHTASWFRSSHQISLSRVVEVYTELSLRQIGVTSAVERPTSPARPRKAKSSPSRR